MTGKSDDTLVSTLDMVLNAVAPRSPLKLLRSKGLRVDLGFFNDLLVPEYHFPAEYWFHSQDGLWVWKYEGNDMYLDLKEPIRCACLLTFAHPPTLQP